MSQTRTARTEHITRKQYEEARRENTNLLAKIEELEQENKALRRSVYEVNLRWQNSQMHKKIGGDTFDISRAMSRDASGTDENTSFDTKDKSSDGRFSCKKVLRGHGQVMHVIKYSPCGKWLAAGCGDCKIRIWANEDQHIGILEGHMMAVTDLSWSANSEFLASASLDYSVRMWNTKDFTLVNSVTLNHFVQSVGFLPNSTHTVFASTATKTLHVIDIRNPDNKNYWENEHLVNTIHVESSSYVLTGDSGGMLKTWDMRKRSCVDSFNNDSSAICHMNASTDAQETYLAVNSYDNVLRVYGEVTIGTQTGMELLHSVTGHITKNFPIRCSLYRGLEITPTERLEDTGNTYRDTEESHETLTVATGSADGIVRLFDVTRRDDSMPAREIQLLKGHTSRVYGVDFHPRKPMFASSSADGTVRVWATNSRSRR
eukprot:m.21928 g.21928  ORF g.21928 m.21928 type:complete len:431 (-) comp7284_c0_seq2:110-1402(-)